MQTGPNRHYIPKILMKGFATLSKSRKQFHACAYFKNGKVATPNISNVGSARYYYPDAIDNKITEHENQHITAALNILRTSSIGSPIEAELAAPLVAHLATRHAEYAAAGGLIGKGAMNTALYTTILNKKLVKRIWKSTIKKYKLRKLALRYIDSRLAASPPPVKLPKSILRLLLLYYFERKADKWLDEGFTKAKAWLDDKILHLLPEIGHRFQTGVLEKALVPEVHCKALEKLQWSVELSSNHNAILPDCVALYSTNCRDFSAAIWADFSQCKMVYMPISHDRILVGRQGYKLMPVPNNINEIAATCSLNFFLSKDFTPDYQTYIPQIGTNSPENFNKAFKSALVQKQVRALPKKFQIGAEAQIKIAYDMIREKLHGVDITRLG